jgi:PAS domain S-box-containing protein
MKIAALSFNKKLIIGFIITLLLLSVVAFSGYQAIRKLENSHKWETHTHEVINNANQAVEKLAMADGNHLWYMITGDKHYLEAYRNAAIAVSQSVSVLKVMTADNPFQQKQIDTLIHYVHLQITHMNKDVLLNTGSHTALILESKQGHETYMVQCRLWINRIISQESTLLSLRQLNSIHYADMVILIILISAVCCTVYLFLQFLLIKRTFTEKRAATESLSLSESKFHNAFEHSGIGMALVSPEGKWIDINSRVSDIVGYSKEELLKKTFQDITHPDDLNADLAFLNQLHNKEIEMYQMEKRYIHKEGFIVWVMLSVSLIWNSDNMPNFHIAQIVDITAIKKLMEEQQLKNQTLSLTSRKLNEEIRQLHDFNGIVTHNLRGPVSSIVNLAEMISNEDSEQEKQELLELIANSAKTLNETLLDLMQILEVRLNNSLSRDQCSLSAVLEHTLDMFRAEIVRFKVDIVTNFYVNEVSFPKIYLESIFHNIISNSIKYHRLDIKLVIKISSFCENGLTKIIFEDNGIGIDLERYGKDMFKFSKVFHSGYDSKGVGLFITKNQIETYGGSIKVESEPGNGTRFIIFI